jgi:hypothetical protein
MTAESPRRARQFTLRETFILIAVISVLLGLGVGPVRAIHKAMKTAQANAEVSSNVKSIVLAIHNYAEQNRYLPPAVTYTQLREPAYSWRFAMLAFIEQWGPPEYEDGRINQHPGWRADRDKPWNDPVNIVAYGNFYYPLFQRRGIKQKVTGATNFVVVTGSQTAFPLDHPITFGDITDDPATTILVVELTPSNIPWYEPRDLSYDAMSFQINDPDRTKPSIGNRELHGAFAGMADGSVRWLPESTPPETVKAMLTIAGGEQVELPER